MSNSSFSFAPSTPNAIDPFSEVLDSLKNSLKNVEVIDPILDDVTEIVNVIDTVLKDVNQIPEILTGVTEILETLDVSITFLEPIPIVGEVAAVCETVVNAATELVTEANEVMTSLDEEIVAPCLPIFNDINEGLTEAKKLVTTISHTIPDCLNTIEIISFMSDVATPLVGVLKGTKPGDDLKALLNTLDEVKKDALVIMTPLSKFLASLESGIKEINTDLGGAYQEIQKVANAVTNGLNTVNGIFEPVLSSFHKIEDAIKPLKWVLDAAACIFDKILKPVINEIMKITGIDDLLKPIEDEIEKKLGIKPINTVLQGSNVNASNSAQWQSGTGTASTASGSKTWTDLVDVLAKYSTQGPNGIKDDMFLLVSAIVGTPIDPNKPAVIPNWPSQPSMASSSLPNTQTTVLASYNRVQRTSVVQTKTSYLSNISSTPPKTTPPVVLSQLLSSSTPVATTSAVEVNSQDNTVANSSYSLSKLQDLAQKQVASLSEVQSKSKLLSTNLALFEKADQLPSYYQSEITEFATLFKGIKSVLDFLLDFDIMKDTLTSIATPVNNAIANLKDIDPSLSDLLKYGNKIDDSVKNLVSEYPNNTAFTDSIHFIDAVYTGAKVLLALKNEAEELNSGLKNQFSDKIEQLESDIESSVTVVTKQIEELTSITQKAIEEATEINDFLVEYASLFLTLSKSTAVISEEAMPKLSQGANVLNTISSILNPLSAIIEDMKCAKNNDNVFSSNLKSEGAGVIGDFKSALMTGISSKNTLIQDSFECVVNKVVSFETIEDNIKAITTYSKSKTIEKTISSMITNITQINTYMKPKYSYSVTQNGVTTQIKNVLVEQSFITNAQSLVEEMQKANQ